MPRINVSFKIGTDSLNFSLVISPHGPVQLLLERPSLPEAQGRWARLVEVQAAGFNQHDHHGNKYTGTNPGGFTALSQPHTRLEAL